MARDLLALNTLIVLVVCACGVDSNIHILGICGKELSNMCYETFNKYFKENINSDTVNWTLLEGSPDYVDNLNRLSGLSRSDVWNVAVAIGTESVINAVTTYAKTDTLPVLAYDTSPSKSTIFPEALVKLHPDMFDLGQAVSELFHDHRDSKTCVVIQDIYLLDGFVEGVWSFDEYQASNSSRNVIINGSESFHTSFHKLQAIRESGCKVIIVHCEPKVIRRVYEIGSAVGIYQTSYAWILVDSEILDLPEIDNSLPCGFLLVRPSENQEEFSEILYRSLTSLENFSHHLYYSDTSNNSYVRDQLYRSIMDVAYNESNRGLSFDTTNNRRSNFTFQILNKKDGTSPKNTWREVGYFSKYAQNISSTVWPGSSNFGPIGIEHRVIRVVTRPAEPLVFIKNTSDGLEPCLGEIRCYKLVQQEQHSLSSPQPEYLNGNVSYEMYCCSGIAVDLFHTLSIDLSFEYELYFEDNNDYGTYKNGNWSGMMGGISSGNADVIIGAFSITSERSEQILFTEAFHISGYSMITPSVRREPSIDAFLAPLDPSVWICIFLSATLTGFATSVLEWNSPFGLNPWGKKRRKNYTLGSGLLMAFSVLFGHTVSTKSPKSWPSKVLQNFWSGLAIFIVSSYTANLAAYLAGNIGQDEISSIYDQKINTKTVSAPRSSAVVHYINKMNTPLSRKLMERDFLSTAEMIRYLRNGDSEVYLDDTTILEYAMSVYDANCSVIFSGREFGENLYAFGLSKDNAWLRDRFSALIMSNLESGLIDDIQAKYVKKRECSKERSIYIMYGLEHTGGLFIGLACSVVISIMLIGLEHSVYLHLVPFIRKKRSDSKWKSRNLEFINQRLYRTIMSQKLVSPQQTAREMVKLMKDRQFARLFQKNELHRTKATKETDNVGMRFMDLTHSIMKSQKNQIDKHLYDTNENNVIFATSSSATLYQVNEENEDDIAEEDSPPNVNFIIENEKAPAENETAINDPSVITLECTPTSTPNNLKRNEDQESYQNVKTDAASPSARVQVNCLWKRHTYSEHHGKGTHLDSKQILQNRKSAEVRRGNAQTFDLHRKFGTWPSLPTIENSSPEVKERVSHRSSPSMTGFANVSDRESLLTDKEENNESGDESKCNVNYYKHSLKMKDNRVKSTIRRHAIAKFRRHSSSVFDECAVDALTKEDLMILWKRSEIELQTKLNRVTLQNAHLKKLLRTVDQRQISDATEHEFSDSELLCTRL